MLFRSRDGDSYGDVQKGVLRDRGHLADEGVVVVTVAVNHETGEIVYGPDLDSHGVMGEPEGILEKAGQAVHQAVQDRSGAGSYDHSAIQQTVKQAAQRVLRAELSRKPVILPVVIEL